ncbi:MAG: polysaccharide biosynthesis protein [Coriobacteriia bacterium]|nr:polysaccharide biosynthesis protein [Coriobacteriia bacterium]MCL2749532.1 polysaccharide biosynthesis protein [Coriobacteriia bacterium]
MFKDKTLLIVGGTGSFGHAVLDRFLDTDIGEIRILSRDEKKQDDMRHHYQISSPEQSEKLKFYIGDVRDMRSVDLAMTNVDFLFQAAALKQVPSCEFFPIEAVKTNILGTNNVITSAVNSGVSKVVCLSTDKAAYPINAMGMSKALMEKTFVALSRTVDPQKTTISGTRYGNVMCSRGSVIPLFIDQMKNGLPLTITEPNMTRFMMSLEEAVELVLYAFENADTGDLMVQKASACTIGLLAEVLQEMFGREENTRVIGIRHGEKMHETLLTAEEHTLATDEGQFYRVPADSRALNYNNYFTEGQGEVLHDEPFTSSNTYQLTKEELKQKLLVLPYVKQELENWN